MRHALPTFFIAVVATQAAEPVERVLGRPSGPPVTVRWEADEGRIKQEVYSDEFVLVLPDDRRMTARDFDGEEMAGRLTYTRPPRKELGKGEPIEVRITASPRRMDIVFADEPLLAALATEAWEVRVPVRVIAGGRALVLDGRWLMVAPEGSSLRLLPGERQATRIEVRASWRSAQLPDGRWVASADGARILHCEEGESPEAVLATLSAPPKESPPAAPPLAPGR